MLGLWPAAGVLPGPVPVLLLPLAPGEFLAAHPELGRLPANNEGVSDFWDDLGFAVLGLLILRRLPPPQPRPRRYTPRPMMATRYQCLCDRDHPHPI